MKLSNIIELFMRKGQCKVQRNHNIHEVFNNTNVYTWNVFYCIGYYIFYIFLISTIPSIVDMLLLNKRFVCDIYFKALKCFLATMSFETLHYFTWIFTFCYKIIVWNIFYDLFCQCSKYIFIAMLVRTFSMEENKDVFEWVLVTCSLIDLLTFLSYPLAYDV